MSALKAKRSVVCMDSEEDNLSMAQKNVLELKSAKDN